MRRKASVTVRNALELPPILDAKQYPKGRKNSHHIQRRLSVASASVRSEGTSMRVISSSDIINVDEWVSDSKSKHCLLCGKGFTTRCNLKCRSGRHHCRYCGVLACDDCTRYRLHGARCCRDCKDTSQLQSISQESGANSTDSEKKQGYESTKRNSIAMSVEERKKLHASNLWKTKYLITPDASAWICWETFMLLLIAYESVTAPMQISIFRLMDDESKGHIIDVVDIIVTVAFFFDIFFRCRKTYIDPVTREYCEDPLKVLHQYFKDRLLLDVLATIPMKYIVLDIHSPRWIKLFVLLRLIRLPYLMSNVTEFLKTGNAVFRNITESMELFIYFFILVHVAGCCFVFCGLVEIGDGSRSVRRVGWLGHDGYADMHDADALTIYVTSIYWAFATTTTVGYGDITAGTLMEKAWAMIVMAGGNILSAFIMGTLAAGLSKALDEKNERSKKFESVVAYLNECDAPPQLMEMVKSYYDALWLINNSWMDEKPTDDLPEFLKIEINKCRHRQMLIRSPLIKSIDRNNRSDAIVAIVQHFKPRILLPGQTAYDFGRVGENIFFIRRGSILRLEFKGGKTVGGEPLQIGDYFGDAFVPATPAIKNMFKGELQGLEIPGDKKFVIEGTKKRISSIMVLNITEFELLSLKDLKIIWKAFPKIQHVMSYVAVSRRLNLLLEEEFDDHAILRSSIASIKSFPTSLRGQHE